LSEPLPLIDGCSCYGCRRFERGYALGMAEGSRLATANLGLDRWPVLAAFLAAMVRKLDANKEKKGGREGWRHDDPADLLRRVNEEAAEMRGVVEARGVPASEVLDEAADVANMAMMVADAAGAFGEIP
jgi:NTP pyrophosphatase (non-canonical NTP hydrolase)